ncbi:hypothetical protein O181_114433 [Austropuccinia psidii MF-1]|uniref:Uncharacterized protein n=1 Tax=Austropuccinia psidii MF-1 TaxID=1389203 RepID=A0A9Q3K4E7_9BASI|nr:hypothetical protein [Austropuccinia psidii MF-1]
MPLQFPPPERQTKSQARAKDVITLTPRVPLDGIPDVPELRAHLDRGQVMERAAQSRKEGRGPGRSSSLSGVVGTFPGISRTTLKGTGEDDAEEGEGSDSTDVAPTPVGASKNTGGQTIAQSDQPVSHQSEPSLLAIMKQMTQIMANLQAALSSEASRSPVLKTPSMKAPECFDENEPLKFRGFIQSFKFIFHNDNTNFSEDRKKVLYATSFCIGRDEKKLSLIFPI